jgi:hypothetical protein
VAKVVEELEGPIAVNTNSEVVFFDDPNAPKMESPDEMMCVPRLSGVACTEAASSETATVTLLV